MPLSLEELYRAAKIRPEDDFVSVLEDQLRGIVARWNRVHRTARKPEKLQSIASEYAALTARMLEQGWDWNEADLEPTTLAISHAFMPDSFYNRLDVSELFSDIDYAVKMIHTEGISTLDIHSYNRAYARLLEMGYPEDDLVAQGFLRNRYAGLR